MKSLKINLEEDANSEKLIELLLLIKGVKSVEIQGENTSENDIKNIMDKTKNQLKTGDYESFVNDLFDAFITKKS
jgi:hypothetical protein